MYYVPKAMEPVNERAKTEVEVFGHVSLPLPCTTLRLIIQFSYHAIIKVVLLEVISQHKKEKKMQ